MTSQLRVVDDNGEAVPGDPHHFVGGPLHGAVLIVAGKPGNIAIESHAEGNRAEIWRYRLEGDQFVGLRVWTAQP
jgi:hypothetical protein